MSQPLCGICGEAIGISLRCVHQPAPATTTQIVTDDDLPTLEELLASYELDGIVDPMVVDLTEDDLNAGLPTWNMADALHSEADRPSGHP